MADAGADIDEVLKVVGEFGSYQRRIYFLLCIPLLFVGASSLSYVFIAASPQYRCLVPGCDSGNEPAFNASFLPFTIPVEENGHYCSCQRYLNLNYSRSSVIHFTGLNTTLSSSTGWSSSAAVTTEMTVSADGWHDNDIEDRPSMLKTKEDTFHAFTQKQVEQQCSAKYFSKMTVEDCPEGYVFDRTVFESTIIMEFNLTCESSWEGQAAQSTYFAGNLMGAFFFGILSDKWGRRPTILLNILLMAVTGVGTALVPNMAAFNIMRFLNAMTSIGLFQTAFVLALEFVGVRYRVLCGMLGHYVFALGEVLLGALGLYFRSWRMLQLVISAPLTGGILYWFVVPESPRWLLSKGRHDDLREIMESVARVNKREFPGHLFDGNSTAPPEGDAELLQPGMTGARGEGARIPGRTAQDSSGMVDEVFLVGSSSSIGRMVDSSERSYSVSLLDVLKTPVLGLRLASMLFIWVVTTLVYYGLTINSTNITGSEGVRNSVASSSQGHASGHANFFTYYSGPMSLWSSYKLPVMPSSYLDGNAFSSFSFIPHLLTPHNRPYVQFILNALMELPGYTAALLLLQFWGRRPALFLSLLLAGFACAGAGLVYDKPPIHALIASLVGKVGITSAFGVIYLYSAEVFPTSARNTVLGLCSTVARIGGMLAPFSEDMSWLYPPMPFLIFGALSCIAALASLVQPETLGTVLPSTVADAVSLGKFPRPLVNTPADDDVDALLDNEEDP